MGYLVCTSARLVKAKFMLGDSLRSTRFQNFSPSEQALSLLGHGSSAVEDAHTYLQGQPGERALMQ